MAELTSLDVDDVGSESVAYKRMSRRWDLIQDLLGGTLAMRDAATKWLPMEEGESAKRYAVRLRKTVLFPGLKNAIEKATAKPFSKPVTAKDVPEKIEYLISEKVDGSGSLTSLACNAFRDMIERGKTYFVVDFTRVAPNQNGEVATLRDEEGARAYIHHVPASAVIGWDYSEDGSVLERVRIRETRTQKAPGKDYVDEEKNFVRVLYRDRWELWQEVEERKNDKKNRYDLVEEGTLSLGEIPIVEVFAKRRGKTDCEPPFEDLAWVNLEHWQSSSDQRSILTMARFAILFGSGLSSRSIDEGLEVGPYNAILEKSAEANLKYVEHSGAAIGAGERDLKNLEARMELLGMAPFVERSAQSTATGKRIDAEEGDTVAQKWVRDVESALQECFKIAARWHGIDPREFSDAFAIDIFSDFKISSDTSELSFLLQSSVQDRLSTETFVAEVKRRGLLPDELSVEDELARIESESMPMPPIDDPGEELDG